MLVSLLLTLVLAACGKAQWSGQGAAALTASKASSWKKEGFGSGPWVAPSACSPQELVVEGSASDNLCGGLSLKVDLCGQVQVKTPSIHEGLWNGPSEEKRLTDETRRALEHRLGISLAKTEAVAETTREFALRLYNLIVKAGKALDGLDEAEALTTAFAPKCSVHNTGFPGLEPEILKQVLVVDGNLREVFGLVYCLTKNWAKPIDNIFKRASQPMLQDILGSAAGQRAWQAANVRGEQVSANVTGSKYTWGVADYIFPSQDSWVHFTFNASLPTEAGGAKLWLGAREWAGSCQETELTTNSTGVYPPLSQREITAECANETLPCKLKWYPGEGCFTITDDNVFVQRAERFGYRVVAGPSGTTANVLQLALLLGFAPEDMPALRATMLGWLVPVDDHSVVEVMLAAQPFVESSGQPDCNMQWGVEPGQDRLADLQKIWPEGLVLDSSWGPQLHGPELWWLQKANQFRQQGQGASRFGGLA